MPPTDQPIFFPIVTLTLHNQFIGGNPENFNDRLFTVSQIPCISRPSEVQEKSKQMVHSSGG
jgi:hypothetical protein